MEVIKTDIEGVLIIEPRIFKDARGYFFESFSQREFDEKVAPILGHPIHFCQDNESMSSYGVMRGLHFQRPPFTQSKLVRCVKGAVPFTKMLVHKLRAENDAILVGRVTDEREHPQLDVRHWAMFVDRKSVV